MTDLESEIYNTGNKTNGLNNRNKSFNENQPDQFYFHLGILIFAPFLNKLSERGLHFIKQWLVAILLGCQNIEQTKELNYRSLERIIGETNKTLRLQRLSLKELSTKSKTHQILKFNADLLNVKEQSDFYYDPHTKQYTGDLKILATWCPSVRLADKGINMDYIHTTSGHPVYFKTADNFYDLRQRFKVNINEFRELIGFNKERELTYIIDRGIYSIEVFKEIISDPHTHIITWEKGYNKDKWDENSPYKKGIIFRKRNYKKDIKQIHYHYQVKQWDKNSSMKQIIVRVLDDNWDQLFELSILTDDNERNPEEVIKLMLNRWVQENDFKYMIEHFGINQITSYAFIDYKDLKDKIEDKFYTCNKHKSQTKEIKKVRSKLKTALMRKFNFSEKYNSDFEDLSLSEQERKEKIWKNIKELNLILKDLEQERRKTVKKVSKIDELIEMDYKKLDTSAKDFMDAIKILARNIFYLSFKPFKDKYNNYRDDHYLFRHLSRADGKIQQDKNGLVIKLIPKMEFQKKIKNIIKQVLDEINATKPELPDNSKTKIHLKLDF